MELMHHGVAAATSDQPAVNGERDHEGDREAPPEERIVKASRERTGDDEDEGVIDDLHGRDRYGVGSECDADCSPVSSIEERTAGEGPQAIEQIADPNATDPAAAVAEETYERELQKRLASLPERTRRVVELRFGLADGVAQTASAVAAELGVSPQRVRQIELRALAKLAAPRPDELQPAA